jgi:hypothetical protein
MSNRLDDARDRVVSNLLELDELGKELEKPGLLASDVRKIDKRIKQLGAELPELREDWERQRAIRDARRAIPPAEYETRSHRGDGKTPPRLENPMSNSTTGSGRGRISGSPHWATARGELFTESIYRPDLRGQSFFRDLVSAARMQDPDAMERLMAHHRTSEWARAELRDVTTADPGAAGFLPPLYMGDLWIDKERAGRPLANAVRQIPLSPVGKTMTFPKVQTAPEAEVQAAEADAVNEVNFDSETYSRIAASPARCRGSTSSSTRTSRRRTAQGQTRISASTWST